MVTVAELKRLTKKHNAGQCIKLSQNKPNLIRALIRADPSLKGKLGDEKSKSKWAHVEKMKQKARERKIANQKKAIQKQKNAKWTHIGKMKQKARERKDQQKATQKQKAQKTTPKAAKAKPKPKKKKRIAPTNVSTSVPIGTAFAGTRAPALPAGMKNGPTDGHITESRLLMPMIKRITDKHRSGLPDEDEFADLGFDNTVPFLKRNLKKKKKSKKKHFHESNWHDNR